MAPRRPVALKQKRSGGPAPADISLALFRDATSGLYFALIIHRRGHSGELRAEDILSTSPNGMETEEEAKRIGIAMLDTVAKQIREAGAR